MAAAVMAVALAFVAPAPSAQAVPSKPVVVALCHGANQSWPQNFDQAYFAQMWQDTGGSETVADYWRDVSQGEFEIGGSLVMDVQLSVSRDAIGDRDENDYAQCRAGALAELAARGLDVADFLGVVVFKPQTEGRTTTMIDDDDTELTVQARGPSVAADWPAAPFTLVLTKTGSLWANADADIENVLVTAVTMNLDGTTTFTIVREQLGYRPGSDPAPPAKAWPSNTIVKDIADIYGSAGRLVVPAQSDPTIVTHEFGHFLGFAHSRTMSNAPSDYGDCFDIMSAAACPGHYFDVEYDYGEGTVDLVNGPGMTSVVMDLEGWLAASERTVFPLPAAGACHQQTYSMKGLGLGGAGWQQIRVPVTVPIPGGVTSEYLTVELRSRQFFWDQGIPFDGFVLHLKGDDDRSYWIDDGAVGGSGGMRDDLSYVYDAETADTGDDLYFHVNTIDADAGTGQVTIGTCPFANDLAYTGPTTITYHTRPDVTATWSWHAPVAMTRVDVDFELGGPGGPDCFDTISRDDLSDGVGQAVCRIDRVALAPGVHDMTVWWDGSDEFAPASDVVPVTVTARDSTLLVDAPAETAYHDRVTLRATLSEAAHPDDTSPDTISARQVELSIGAGASRQSCTGSTGVTGVVQCSIPRLEQVPGTVAVQAAFAGDDFYASSSDSTTFTVVRRDSVLEVATPPETIYHDPVTLDAVLREAPYPGTVPGDVLPGRTVELSIGSGASVQSCSAVTDAAGAVQCTIPSVEQVPSDTVVASVSFTGDTWYESSADSTTFVVVKRATELALDGPSFIADQGDVELHGVLVEDGGAPVAGRDVEFALGQGADRQTCDAETDATGAASCVVAAVDQPLGTQPISASFTGDPYYLPSADQDETIVFAWTDGGHFVIGDGSTAVGGSAMFWGSEWYLDNDVSGGPSPSAFKGFASDPTGPLACGADWNSSGGDSADAPAEIPAYTAMVVTDAVAKRGRTVEGTTAAIAIVEVDPGYDANPGHPGTATVLGFLCSG